MGDFCTVSLHSSSHIPLSATQQEQLFTNTYFSLSSLFPISLSPSTFYHAISLFFCFGTRTMPDLIHNYKQISLSCSGVLFSHCGLAYCQLKIWNKKTTHTYLKTISKKNTVFSNKHGFSHTPGRIVARPVSKGREHSQILLYTRYNDCGDHLWMSSTQMWI